MLHIVQSDPGVTAGVLSELLDEWQIEYRIVRADLGEPLPEHSAAVIILGGEMGVHDEAQHPFLVPLKAFLRQVSDMSRLAGTRRLIRTIFILACSCR